MENRERQGLLDQIAATALDDDYYAYRPARPGRGRGAGALRSSIFALVLVAVGLVTAQAALQVRAQRSAAELERRTLLDDVVEQQGFADRNRAILDQLSLQVATLERDRGGELADARDLATVAGAVPVEGPGLRMRITHGRGAEGEVTDEDLQILANGLWHAGAEAVSIDGERLGSLSSIRSAGDAITVNYRSVRPPYDVHAVGDPETMEVRFNLSPVARYWEARHRRSRVGFTVTRLSDVVLPAVPARRLTITHADVLAKGVDP